MKLSPNLRKQTREVKNAVQIKDKKKTLELEVKKLLVILAMVREPEDTVKEDVEEENDPLK